MPYSPGPLSPKQQLILAAESVKLISKEAIRMKERLSPDSSTPNEDYYDWAVEFAASVISENQGAFDFLVEGNDFAHHLTRAVQRDDKFGESLRKSAPIVVAHAYSVALNNRGAAPDDHAGKWGAPGPDIFASDEHALFQQTADSLALAEKYADTSPLDGAEIAAASAISETNLRNRYEAMRRLGVSPEESTPTMENLNPDLFAHEWYTSTGKRGAPGSDIFASTLRDPSQPSMTALELSVAYSQAVLDAAEDIPAATQVSPETMRERYEELRALKVSPEKAMSMLDDLSADRFDDGSLIPGLDSIEIPKPGFEPPSL